MTVYDFGYTGKTEELMIEFDGIYTIECWGAQGGSEIYGGKGAYIKSSFKFKKGDCLYINVGSQGSGNSPSVHISNRGFNGGADSGFGQSHGIAFGGGGASDVRIGGKTAKYMIIVAAGGGGGQEFEVTTDPIYRPAFGGYGGNILDKAGDGGLYCCGNPGEGATVDKPGNGGIKRGNATNSGNQGGSLLGGSGASNRYRQGGAGGGGGYYGGGGGSDGCGGAAGGGGSSYVDNDIGSKTVSKSGSQEMPCITNPSLMTGNSGNGHIRISINDRPVYYGIEHDGKIYIPNKAFYDESKKEFVPISKEEFLNIKSDKTEYIHDIKYFFFKRRIIENDVIPITIFKGGRIIKVSATNNIANNIKVEFNIESIENSLVGVKDEITKDESNMIMYASVNTRNVKSAFMYAGKLIGEKFEIISSNEIRAYGISGKDLENYNIKFKKSNIVLKFADRVSNTNKYLNKLIIKKKKNEQLERLDKNSVDVNYNYNTGYIFVKVISDLKEIVINKNNFKEEHCTNSLYEF